MAGLALLKLIVMQKIFQIVMEKQLVACIHCCPTVLAEMQVSLIGIRNAVNKYFSDFLYSDSRKTNY